MRSVPSARAAPSAGSADGGAVAGSVGDEIGGYRLVRRLGAGHHAEVHLAVPTGGGPPVAIAVARPHVSEPAVLARAHALWRARGAHVAGLLDAIDQHEIGPRVPGGGAPALVLEWIPTPLASLLSAAGGVGLPAAATVLLPIAAALRRMHEAGVAHGGIGPAAIRLDERGAPVLVGFGSAQLFTPGLSAAALATAPGVVDDVRAFQVLATAMLDSGSWSTDVRRDPATASGAVGAAAAASADNDSDLETDPHAWLERFEQRVVERITPGPVELPADLPVGMPHRPLDVDRMRHRRTRPAAARGSSALAGMLDDIGSRTQGWAAGRLPDGLAASVVPAVRRVVSKLGPVRARAWVPAALVLLTLIVAIVVVPAGGGEATTVAGSTPAPTWSSSEGSSEPTSEPTSETTSEPTDEPLDAQPATDPADPEIAAVALLNRRAECLTAADAACIASVVQTGSPAESADLIAVASASSTPPAGAAWRAESAALVDLLGGAALVDVVVETGTGRGTVPVLVVLSGSQWRIRAILAEPAIAP